MAYDFSTFYFNSCVVKTSHTKIVINCFKWWRMYSFIYSITSFWLSKYHFRDLVETPTICKMPSVTWQ